MGDTTTIRIGLQSARELEIDVEDSDIAGETLEAAFADGERLVWLTDSRGHRFAIVVEKLAFVEFERDSGKSGIGFASVS
jgi:hypothetical protein